MSGEIGETGSEWASISVWTSGPSASSWPLWASRRTGRRWKHCVRLIREFRLIALDDRPLLLSDYRRISGSPIQSTYDLLRELYEIIPEDRVEGMRVTGSGSRTIAKVLGLFFENEFKAIARMMGDLLPARCARSSSSAARVRSTSGWKTAASRITTARGECAAGTGSFPRPAGAAHAVFRGRSGRPGVQRGMRGADCGALQRVRQERHDPRAAEGLFAGGDPARAVRCGGAQFQEFDREGSAGGSAGGADRRGVAECRSGAARCARPSR